MPEAKHLDLPFHIKTLKLSNLMLRLGETALELIPGTAGMGWDFKAANRG